MTANNSRFTLAAAAVLTLSALWVVITSLFIPAPASAGAAPAPREGFAAPDFSLTTINGGNVRLSDLRGKVVFLNFWTSWCPPCAKEMPAFQLLHEQSPGVAVIAINLTDQDSLENVQAFLDQHQITFDIPLDKNGDVSILYQIQALPTSFFIDKQGIIRKVVYGGPISKSLLFAETSRLVEER
jgi:peroxiredoxin